VLERVEGNKMTVKKLHKILSGMIKTGNGRKPVCIEKTSFNHPLESDGCVILPVYTVTLDVVEHVDDDGGMGWNKDGTVHCTANVVLRGGW
jgi:hypothetical protein